MKVAAHEAVDEDGQIVLFEAIRLPERAKVDAVVTGTEETRVSRMRRPRPARSERAVDFIEEVAEEPGDADS